MTVLQNIQQLHEYGFDSAKLASLLGISIIDLLYSQRNPNHFSMGDQLVIQSIRQQADAYAQQGIENVVGEF